jgi:hypothetical protein
MPASPEIRTTCPSPAFALDRRRSSKSSSSSRPTRAVILVAWSASKRLSTVLARSAAQARADPLMPLRSLGPRSFSSKRLPRSRRVLSATMTHWTDPTSLELFSRAVDRVETLRVLLIVTFRSEFDPPWIGWSHATAMTISRLTKREAGAMIDRVVGNKLLAGSRQARHYRAHRWHSPVRRGNDEGCPGGRERGCGPAHGCGGSVPGPGRPRELTCVADRSSR